MPLTATFNDVADKLYGWTQAAILMLPNLGAALLVVAVFWLVARLASGLTARVLRRTTPYDEINWLLTRVVWLAVMATGLFIALGILQLDKTVTSLIAGAGILTLVVGLAFQDLAANFVAGLLLQLRHPFRKGHLIDTNGFYGIVEHINLRSTILRTLTGQVAIIPNKDVFQTPLVNFSQSGRRRVDLKVGVSYGDDLERAQRIALEARRRHSRTRTGSGRGAVLRRVRRELDRLLAALLDRVREGTRLPAGAQRSRQADQEGVRRQ